MQIRDIATGGPVLTVREDEDLALANQIMLWAGLRHLPVVRDGAVVGVLSAGDVLRRAAQMGWREASKDQVGSVMSQPAETIAVDEDVSEAAARMVKRHIGCLPVVDNGALAGIVTRTDLLAHEAREGLPPAPAGGEGVASVMRPDPVTVHEDDDLLEAAARMKRVGIRHLPVVDGAERVVGMLGADDLRAAIGAESARGDGRSTISLKSMKVAHAMTTPPVTVPETASLGMAARQFMDHRVGALPVVDTDDRLVGIISYVDMLAAAYRPMG